MDQLKKQVTRARGRLNLQQFIGIAIWSLFGWLMVGTIVLAVPKLWALGWEPQQLATFKWAVIGGSVGLGLATATVWTWLRRRNDLDAAIELDRRFGLKERVSSSLSLTPSDLETDAGRALLSDAVRRVERIEVKDRFSVGTGWAAFLPLIPAVGVFALAVLVPDAVDPSVADAEANNVAIQKQIKTSTEILKKRIAERRKEAAEKGLTDAEQIFDKLEKGLDGMHEKAPADRKKAMVKLNNLAKDLKDRADRLKDAQQIRKQMNQLKDLKQGPADKMAKAMKNGDFNKAMQELKNLQDKLAKGELSNEEKEALEQQMQQMQEKLHDVADAHQQAMQQLKNQIEQAKQDGDNAAAGQMQQQLEQLQQQQQAMNKMQQMADKLGQAAQQLKEGQHQAAAQQLEDLAQDLQQMQNMEDEIKMVEQALDQIAQAKDGMKCDQCQGQGCDQCQAGQNNGQLAQGGQGDGQKQDGPPGRGMGAGAGQGERPEQEHDTGAFDSQVKADKLGTGEAYVVGTAGGPNRAGQARENIKEAVDAVMEGEAKPLTNKRLPRPQREHAKQYFDAFREGE